MNALETRLEQERLRRLTDRRMQYRNMTRLTRDEKTHHMIVDVLHPDYLTKDVLDGCINGLVDVIDNVDVVDTKQPALGLFSAERLAFIQRNFQRYTKDSRR